MKKINLKKLLILTVVSVALIVGCLFIFKIHEADTTAKVLTSICNSFFVVGGIILCLGLLTWCTNHGAFVGLMYGFKTIFERRRFEKSFQQRQSYAEYRESKLAKQKEFLHFILVGVVYLLISINIMLFI